MRGQEMRGRRGPLDWRRREGGGKAVLGTAGDGARRLPGHKTAGPGLGGQRGAAGSGRREGSGTAGSGTEGSAAERPARPAQVTGAAGSGSPGWGALGRLRLPGLSRAVPAGVPARVPTRVPADVPAGCAPGRAEGTAGPLCLCPPRPPSPPWAAPPASSSLDKGMLAPGTGGSCPLGCAVGMESPGKGTRSHCGRGLGIRDRADPLSILPALPCPSHSSFKDDSPCEPGGGVWP